MASFLPSELWAKVVSVFLHFFTGLRVRSSGGPLIETISIYLFRSSPTSDPMIDTTIRLPALPSEIYASENCQSVFDFRKIQNLQHQCEGNSLNAWGNWSEEETKVHCRVWASMDWKWVRRGNKREVASHWTSWWSAYHQSEKVSDSSDVTGNLWKQVIPWSTEVSFS